MSKEEYLKNLNFITKEYEIEKSKLAHDYAFSNNPYNIGDIISDGHIRIIIQRIQFSKGGAVSGSNMPMCVYSGRKIIKDGSMSKDETSYPIWQNRVKSEIDLQRILWNFRTENSKYRYSNNNS